MKFVKKIFNINVLYRHGAAVNSYDLAKFIAILFMVIDHAGKFILFDVELLRGLGRLAFPIFFFLIGYSKNFKTKWNLFFLGIIITAFSGVVLKIWLPFDILISAFLVKIILGKIDVKNFQSRINLAIIFFTLALWNVISFYIFSYGTLCLMFAICGLLKRDCETETQKINCNIFILSSLVFDFIYQNIFFDLGLVFTASFAFMSALLMYIFMSFRMREFEVKNNIARDIILFTARNSLLIYFVHVMLFIGVAGFLMSQH